MTEFGTLFYNGFFFPHAINATVQIRAVRDSTNRFTKWLEYSLSVSFIAYPGCDEAFDGNVQPGTGLPYDPLFPSTAEDADEGARKLRKLLSNTGGVLQFIDKGLGDDLTIIPNADQGIGVAADKRHIDLKFGPQPEVTAWEPVGANKAIHIGWTCVFRIADCEDPGFATLGEFSYEISWSLDGAGLTTRTITGKLVIAAQRRGSQLLNSADQQRDKIRFAVPLRFLRTTQTYTLSDDRSTLSFVIIDKEQQSDFPFLGGIVRANVTHTLTSDGRNLLIPRWKCTIAGSISVAKNADKSLAWKAYLFVVENRLQQVRTFAKTQRDEDDRQGGKKPGTKASQIIILNRLSISEEVFGLGMSFSLTYTIMTKAANLFEAAGMWNKVPGSTFEAYRTTMSQLGAPNDRRGHAQMEHLPSDDLLITFCDTLEPPIVKSDKFAADKSKSAPFFGTDCPPISDSYVEFHAWASYLRDTTRVYNIPLGGKDTLDQKEVTPSLGGNNQIQTNSDSKEPIYSTRSNSVYRVRFRGWALRLGFKIPEVVLLEFGGRPTRQLGEQNFTPVLLARLENCNLYAAHWDGIYLMDGPPTGDLVVTKPEPRVFPQ